MVSISDDDDEEFAGFDDNGVAGSTGRSLAANRSKRIRNTNSVLAAVIKQELPEDDEMLQVGGKKTTPQRPTVRLDDPIFRKPFEYGWKRELVYRAVAGISKEKGEVYYFTPTSKKLRTRTEIQQNLTHDLTLDNFTFIKEPLGLGPDLEIIRNAKSNAATMKRASLANTDASPVTESPLGKRIPKPKGPKGGSPPPSSIRILNRSRSSVGSPRSPFGRPVQVKEKEDVKVQVTKPPPKGPTATVAAASKAKQEDSKKRKSEPVAVNSDNFRDVPVVGKIPNDTVRSTINVGGAKNKKGTKGGAANVVAKRTNFNYSHYFRNVAVGYNVLLETFQYLKVKELLRASCVCRVWNQAANYPSLWSTVRMKNSQVNDWNGFANALRRHGTTGLDLRKMLAPSNSEEMWQAFSRHIGTVNRLEAIDLCRCPSAVVESLFRTNTNLRILNAVTIKDDIVDLDGVENLTRLEELRLKPENWVEFRRDLTPMRNLHCLRHLALTFVKQLGNANVEILGELTALESLEIGECNDISETLARNVLPRLVHLERLRLEKGQMNCNTSAILAAIAPLVKLKQLELVNFDIKAKFNEEIANCAHIEKLLIIPTYISQSATTNNMILSGMIRLSQSLRCFTWVVTLELLRVTELYVVQCDASTKKEKRVPDESIPILKPVPGIMEDGVVTSGGTQCPDAQQVEIVPLSKVESILHTYLPETFIKIVKAQFHTTWRLNLVEPTATP
uniref:Putative partner of paired n=1 Tax=Nyssomyia neivai TaxID=330878 RepID=A0A1L8DBZ1_9DIPT